MSSVFTLGFTGTRRGLTSLQKQAVGVAILAAAPDVAVHGDCVGADQFFHEAVVALLLRTRVVVMPGCTARGDSPHRAYCNGETSDVREPRPYLERNRAIVDASTVLLAAPADLRYARGGTWHTIGEARRRLLDHIVVFPDGLIEVNYSQQWAEALKDASLDEMREFFTQIHHRTKG